MLRFEVSVEPNEQHQNRYPDERRAKRLAQMPQPVNIMHVRIGRDVRGVLLLGIRLQA